MAFPDDRSGDRPVRLTWHRSAVGRGSVKLRAAADAGTLVVGVSGDVDIATAHRLTDGLGCVAGQQGNLVVDLCDVRFMDVSGVRALIEGHRQLRMQGRELVVACEPGGAVARILNLIEVDRSLAIEPSRATAVARVRHTRVSVSV